MKLRISLVFSLYIILVIGVAWLLLSQMRWRERRFVKELFVSQVNSIDFALRERYNRNRVAFEGLEGFIASSEHVTYEEWKTNLTNLDLESRFPAIIWIAFVERVPTAELNAFVESIRNQGIDFKVWPSALKPVAFPVTYITPNRFSGLMGYNLSSDPQIEKLLEKTLSSPRLIETTTLTTKFGKLKKSERIFFLPVINRATGLVQGWIAANLNFATIIEQTIQGLNYNSFKLTVYAGDTKNINNLIYQYNSNLDQTFDYSVSKVMDFGSTQWTFIFETDLPSENLVTIPAFFLVLFLLLLTLSLGLFLYFYYLKKTDQFSCDTLMEKKVLAGTQYAFIATDVKGTITYFNPAAEQLLGYSAEEMIGKQTPALFHDPQEMKDRAEELSKILGREVKPEFEVFVCLAEKDNPENRQWIYTRKDQTRVTVQLSVTALKSQAGETEGYLGVALKASNITL